MAAIINAYLYEEGRAVSVDDGASCFSFKQLSVFNKQQTYHCDAQHTYRQLEQGMITPDFDHDTVE